MKKSLRNLSLAVLFSLSGVYADVQVIPQVADGGGWATTIVLTNTTATTQTAVLTFNKGVGGGATASWTPPFKETVTLSAISLPAGATLFLHTPGTAAALTNGWGELTAATGVEGYAIFTSHAPGNPAQDATAPAAAAASRILVPFDNTSHLITAVALVNPTGASETVSVNIKTSDGAFSTSNSALPANGQTTFLMPTQFPATAGKSGLAEFFTSSGTISGIALRANPSGAFTSAPVYSAAGSPILASSSQPTVGIFSKLAAKQFFVSSAHQIIPQVADGDGWKSTIVLVNTSSQAQLVKLQFHSRVGAAGATTDWTPPFIESITLASFNLPAGSSLFLHTPGTAATLTQGWGELDADSSVVGYAIFTSAAPGNPAQDATAPAGLAATRVLVPFDNASGFIAAVAAANSSAAAETISVNIRTSDGATSAGTLPSLPADGQATFLMPTQFTGTAGKSGLAEFFVTSGSISMIALRANPSGAFTAAPVYFESGSPIISTGGGGGGGGGGTSSDTNPTPAEIAAWIARGSYNAGTITLSRSTSYTITDSPASTGPSATTTVTKSDAFSALFSHNGGTDLANLLHGILPPGFPNLSPTPGSCVVYNLAALTNPFPNYTSVGLDAGPQITSVGPNGTLLAPRHSTQSIGFSYLATGVPNTYLNPGHYTLSGPGGADVGAFSGGLDILPDLVVTDDPANFSVINRSAGIPVHWTGGDPSTMLTISGTSLIIDINNPTAINGSAFVCIQNVSAGQFTVPGSVTSQLPASPSIDLGQGFSFITRGTFSVVARGKGARFTAPAELDILTAMNSWSWLYTPQYQ